MSEVSTLLVWATPQPAILANGTQRQRFQPGEVVDVQPGEFNFGSAIAEMGFWRVIVCDAPARVTVGFLSGDPVNADNPDAPRRLRTRRLRLDDLPDRCTLQQLLASSDLVPPIADPAVFGQAYNVIG